MEIYHNIRNRLKKLSLALYCAADAQRAQDLLHPGEAGGGVLRIELFVRRLPQALSLAHFDFSTDWVIATSPLL